MKLHEAPDSDRRDRVPEYSAMVLLIDDQAIVGHAVRALLLDELDIDMHYCADPSLALELAERVRPTVILQDLVMPTIEGLHLVRLLRNNPATATTPIIVLSSKEDPVTKRDAFVAGANDYLVKLPDKLELVARIRYHSRAYLNQIQRDEAYRALRESQQKLLESNTKLHEANQHLEAATRVKSEFLANMSHEIRTPLAGVIGMTTLLGDTPLSNEQLTYVETIRNSGSALLELINDILDFSKIEAGKLELEEQPFELATCVEETLELLAMKASEKNLALGYIIEPSVPAKLLGDVGRIRQILVNLIGNAVKFTARGEISVRIFRPNDDQAIQVSIRDTGIGIPRDLQDRLFQSFSQIQRPSSRSFGGTGLGLAISKQLTEKMGGRIWVESEADRGSTFHFTMNLKPQSNPSGDQTPSVPNFAGKRVLILEDQPIHGEILVRRIQALGMSPSPAGTAEEALHVIQQRPAFDAVILNSRLRDIAPMDLAKRIRATPAGAFVRLILMSPQHKRLHTQAREAGINSFLNEPVREAQLREAFNSASDTENAFGTTHKISEIDRDLASRYPLRILVAEDNTVNQKVVLALLLKLGYQAEVVSSGVEVIWSLERQSYDLVFMDIQMPEMNGDEASRRIRQRWSDEERPLIIAMTANAMQGDREKCLEAGMDDYVTKPVSIRDLQSTLERWGKYIHNQKNRRPSLPDSGTEG